MNQREREQKARERRERIRREKHQRRSIARHDEGSDSSPTLDTPMMPHRYAAERAMFDMQSVMKDRQFSSVEEMNAAMHELHASGGMERAARKVRARDPKARAQDLAYRAMEATDMDDAVGFITQALDVDSNCTDALRLLAQMAAKSPSEKIMMLADAIAGAEREFGQDFLEQKRGEFWQDLRTRPYMRARHELAMTFQDTGRHAEAIEQFEEMLLLNPNDNQGVRDQLLGLYLARKYLDRARALLEKYDEPTAINVWGRVLLEILGGDLVTASDRLAAARQRNPHAEKYLSGRTPVPKSLGGTYRLGQEDEAQHCAFEQAFAWKRHPVAMEWLKRQPNLV